MSRKRLRYNQIQLLEYILSSVQLQRLLHKDRYKLMNVIDYRINNKIITFITIIEANRFLSNLNGSYSYINGIIVCNKTKTQYPRNENEAIEIIKSIHESNEHSTIKHTLNQIKENKIEFPYRNDLIIRVITDCAQCKSRNYSTNDNVVIKEECTEDLINNTKKEQEEITMIMKQQYIEKEILFEKEIKELQSKLLHSNDLYDCLNKLNQELLDHQKHHTMNIKALEDKILEHQKHHAKEIKTLEDKITNIRDTENNQLINAILKCKKRDDKMHIFFKLRFNLECLSCRNCTSSLKRKVSLYISPDKNPNNSCAAKEATQLVNDYIDVINGKDRQCEMMTKTNTTTITEEDYGEISDEYDEPISKHKRKAETYTHTRTRKWDPKNFYEY